MKLKPWAWLLVVPVLSSCTPWFERDEILDCYGKDSNYRTCDGTITADSLKTSDSGRFWTIDVDSDRYEKDYGVKLSDSSLDFLLVAKNAKSLSDSGFYSLASLGRAITFVTELDVWGDGWRFPIVSVAVGAVTFLDFSTGKANLLDWVKNDME
jgi:hypothetical protein